jgi:hypothetical protein
MKRFSNDTFEEGLNWRRQLHIFLFPAALERKILSFSMRIDILEAPNLFWKGKTERWQNGFPR